MIVWVHGVTKSSPIRVDYFFQPAAHGRKDIVDTGHRNGGSGIRTGDAQNARAKTVRLAVFHPDPEYQGAGAL